MLRELSVAEQRYQAVLAVIEDRLSITEAAAKAGVSRQTVHTWLSRYAEGGLEGLADRSHRPRSCPHQMDAATEVRLVELRQLHPGWGSDRLAYRLEREGVAPVPSRAAISRALLRLGLVTPGRRSSAAAQLPPLGASARDGAVAARRDGRGAAERRARAEGGHRDRRPLALLPCRGARGARHRAPGVRRLCKRPGALRRSPRRC
jgi:transposase